MKLLATHNSATGEKPMWYAWPLIPFARTQGKTILRQYEAGARMFDLRLKLVRGKWHFAHGLFIVRKDVEETMRMLNRKGDCYVTFTYEGGMKHNEEFKAFVEKLQNTYTRIMYGVTSVKYGAGSKGLVSAYEQVIESQCAWPETQSGFLPLDGKNWQTYIPVPYLWWKLGYGRKEPNDRVFTYVDFL